MSTRRWPAWHALRTRVSMSATGSATLITPSVLLPTGLAHARDLAPQPELAEANATQLELADHAAAAAAPLAAGVATRRQLPFPLRFLNPLLHRQPTLS